MSASEQTLDLERERWVLQAALADEDAYLEASRLRFDDFRSPQNRLIWTAIVGLHGEGHAAGLTEVISALREDGNLEKAGGVAYLYQVSEGIADVVDQRVHVEAIRESSARRSLLARLERAAGDLKASKRVADVTASLTSVLLDLTATGEGDLIPEEMAARQLEGELRDRCAGRHDTRAIPTGIPGLDGNLGGMRRGETYVLAADTGVGKTAAALQVATTALSDGYVVLLCSLEMAAVELERRMLAQTSGLQLSSLGARGLSVRQQETCWQSFGRLRRRLWYRVGPQRLGDIAAAARKVVAAEKGQLDLVIVDYLQLVAHGIPGRKREEEVAAISRGLKAIASEQNVPILALSQVNAEGSPRESNAIRHDAGGVIHLVPQEGGGGWLRCEVRKNRYGMTGASTVRFDGERMWFYAPEDGGGSDGWS